MTVRVGNFAGMETVLGVLRDAGLGSIENTSPQIYIGNTGATLKAITSGGAALVTALGLNIDWPI